MPNSAQSDRSSGPIKCTQSTKSFKTCAVCSTKLHVFRSVANCELCTHAVCSRCRVTRRLSCRVARPKELRVKNTIVCTTCIATATYHSAVEVARAELTAQANCNVNTVKGNFRSAKASSFLSSSTISSSNTVLSSNCTRLETPVEGDEEESASSRRRSSSSDVCDIRHPPTATESKLSELELGVNLSVIGCSSDYLDEDCYENEVGRRKTQPPNAFSHIPETVNPLASSLPPKSRAPQINSQAHQHCELMRRMAELRQNAESAYQMTQRNTEMMMWRSCVSTAKGGMDLD